MREKPKKQSQIFRPLLVFILLRYDKSGKPVGLYKFTGNNAGRIINHNKARALQKSIGRL